MKILTVDDNDRVRQLIKIVLSPFADVIVECKDGADAVETYSAHRPNIVLMDIRMPRLDGLSATRQLLARFPDARILILTDDASDAVRAAAAVVGARGIVQKSDLSELESAIRAVLE